MQVFGQSVVHSDDRLYIYIVVCLPTYNLSLKPDFINCHSFDSVIDCKITTHQSPNLTIAESCSCGTSAPYQSKQTVGNMKGLTVAAAFAALAASIVAAPMPYRVENRAPKEPSLDERLANPAVIRRRS